MEKLAQFSEQTLFAFKPTIRVLVVYELLIMACCVAGYNRTDVDAVGLVWIGAFLLSLPVFLFKVIQRLFTSYTVTNSHIIERRGIIWRTGKRIALAHITDSTISVRPIPRLLGVGTVYIETPGSTRYELIMKDVSLRKTSQVVSLVDERKAVANSTTPAQAVGTE